MINSILTKTQISMYTLDLKLIVKLNIHIDKREVQK